MYNIHRLLIKCQSKTAIFNTSSRKTGCIINKILCILKSKPKNVSWPGVFRLNFLKFIVKIKCLAQYYKNYRAQESEPVYLFQRPLSG